MTNQEYFQWFKTNGGILRTVFEDDTASVKASQGKNTQTFLTPVDNFAHLERLQLALIIDLHAKAKGMR